MRNRRKNKRKSMRIVKIFMIAIIFVLGLLVMWTTYQNRFGQVDIVLDAGHGGKDPGAICDDAIEKEITLEITERTKDLLESSGYKVGMTRKDDSFVELDGRAEFANKRNAKVFVSIHCNAAENHDGNGIETFYSIQKNRNDIVLAEMIQKAVLEQTNASDRGIKEENYTVIVRSDMPAALIEVGFISNETEKELLKDTTYQQKLAVGISEGIIRYMSLVE